MASLDSLKASLGVLNDKLTAHLANDGTASAELLAQNAALQTQVADLTAQLAGTITDAQVGEVTATVDAIAARL